MFIPMPVVQVRTGRVQRTGLEHHCGAAVRWLGKDHILCADQRIAAGHGVQPRDHSQQGGFA